jgi:hypothetical protein
VRNIFDQYSQAENRLSHVLATVLHEDVGLREQFLKEFVGQKTPRAKSVRVSTQSFPGLPPLAEGSSKAESVPDIWLYDDAGWCVIIECKISAPFSTPQITRHVATARRFGFTDISKIAITASAPQQSMPVDVISILWPRIYEWLKCSNGIWTNHASRYFEILEAQMIDKEQLKEGALTKFSGFPDWSEDGYGYIEARRVIKLALAELRNDKRLQKTLGMDPSLPGRSAITGSKASVVWDYLQLAQAKASASHTEGPHLTMGICPDCVEAFITIPNALHRDLRRNITQLDLNMFNAMLIKVLTASAQLRQNEPNVIPVLRIVQRRYPSQRSEPFIDADLTVDLRTILPDSVDVKFQPQWIEAAFSAFISKKSNLQMQVGFIFPTPRCQSMKNPHALSHISEAWISCKPVLDLIYGK